MIRTLYNEVNAELEHQIKKDSTRGEPKKLRQRGAEMANTVGKSTEKLKRKSHSLFRE